ncbi:MAG: AAA family ATPase [Solirubrobacterales bacterium]|nr:AAA family ATPase [Solirubrobacterales bacterium]OJU94699.1 MAG: ATP-dependent endonuclease [Solirubrobacterales bacterium 67-14]
MTDAAASSVIDEIVIKNFRRFQDATIQFSAGLNMLVGDNEAGKSTLLEAISLALTGRWQGKLLSSELTPHLINSAATAEYVDGVSNGRNPTPPEIVVELFLAESDDTFALKGTNNSLGEDAPGLRVSAVLDPDFTAEYAEYVAEPNQVISVPTEYYRVDWYDFAGRVVNARGVKVAASTIDASRIRLQSGADYYLQRIITESLDVKQRAELARGYRTLQEQFVSDPTIATINATLDASQDRITDKQLTMEIVSSQSNHWESVIAPHLDRLPFHLSGSGEQHKLKILLALARKLEDAHLILIEEPENHLSFSALNQLIEKISAKCRERQVIISTHSSYVINKLGLERLMLLNGDRAARTTDLPEDTQNYFRKLSGYDTLRLVLAKAVILVEGPSDELIIQRAYLAKHNKRPIEDGIDVINVRGLSAKRFLDLAIPLRRRVAVVTDNDGDYAENVDTKFAPYQSHDFISIHRSDNNDLRTLEPHLVASCGLDLVNDVLGRSFGSPAEAEKFMTTSGNKTDVALAFHDTTEDLRFPQYIQDAVDGIGQ